MEGKVVESKGNKKTPLPTNQQQNIKTNTTPISKQTHHQYLNKHTINIRCAKRTMGVQVAAIRVNSNVKQFERRGPV